MIIDNNIEKFYEGKFIQPKDFRFRSGGVFGRLYRAIALDYSCRRARFLEQQLDGHDNEILDIGCGAGTMLLTDYGRVTGIDYSKASLEIASNIYNYVEQGDVKKMSFKNDNFDYVIAIDVFGHIPVTEKDDALKEIYRVLKPGGKVIFSAVETDGKDWLSRVIHRYPKLYEEVFIKMHGHLGYELPSELIRRLELSGFLIHNFRKISGGLFIDPIFYIEWFRNTEFGRKLRFLYLFGRFVGLLFAIDRIIFRKRSILIAMLRFILGILDVVLVEHFLSIDHTRALAISARKPD